MQMLDVKARDMGEKKVPIRVDMVSCSCGLVRVFDHAEMGKGAAEMAAGRLAKMHGVNHGRVVYGQGAK
jgi:hypothetical protein